MSGKQRKMKWTVSITFDYAVETDGIPGVRKAIKDLSNGNYSAIMCGEFVARKIEGSGRGRLKTARG